MDWAGLQVLAVWGRAVPKTSCNASWHDAFCGAFVDIDKSHWRLKSSEEVQVLVCFLGHSFIVVAPEQISDIYTKEHKTLANHFSTIYADLGMYITLLPGVNN